MRKGAPVLACGATPQHPQKPIEWAKVRQCVGRVSYKALFGVRGAFLDMAANTVVTVFIYRVGVVLMVAHISRL